jgi:serine/threonine protein kinase
MFHMEFWAREVKLLKELCHHPNIVKLKDVFLSWEEQSMHIVYEYGTMVGCRFVSVRCFMSLWVNRSGN